MFYSEPMETETYKGYTIEIWMDESPLNPVRDWDILGTLVCFHRRYDLGNAHTGSRMPTSKDNKPWFVSPDDFLAFADKQGDNLIVLPLYLYDHSGITMSTGPFSCPWDSGQVGWIYCTKAQARKWFGWERITQKRIEQIRTTLKAEVETYDFYLRGAVYGYVAHHADDPADHVDSCWGYYGYPEDSGLMRDAREAIDYHLASLMDNREEQGAYTWGE